MVLVVLRSAKKYIWENLDIERHDSASPDMDDTEPALLSLHLAAPKRAALAPHP